MRQCLCLSNALATERLLSDRIVTAVMGENQHEVLAAIAAYWQHRECPDTL